VENYTAVMQPAYAFTNVLFSSGTTGKMTFDNFVSSDMSRPIVHMQLLGIQLHTANWPMADPIYDDNKLIN
jgi:hypothetical protein